MLFVELLLVHQAYQCQAFIYFPEIEYNFIVGATGMVKFDDGARFLVEFKRACLLIDAIYA